MFASRHIHGSAGRNSQYITTGMIQNVDFAGALPLPNVFRRRGLLVKCATWRSLMREVKRFSTVIQRFRLPIYPHDQRRCEGRRYASRQFMERLDSMWRKCRDQGLFYMPDIINERRPLAV